MPSHAAIRARAWFFCRSGPLAGARYALSEGTARIGRSPENDIVLETFPVVSLFHAEIRREGDDWLIRDAASTNGTYVNGERVEEAALHERSAVRFGKEGPEFVFLTDASVGALDSTLALPDDGSLPAAGAETHTAEDALVADAVMQARRARAEGAGDQTMGLMRDVVRRAVGGARRRHRRVTIGMAAILAAGGAYASWRVYQLQSEKAAIDARIRAIDSHLAAAGLDAANANELITQLEAYQGQGEALRRNMLFRLGAPHSQDAGTERQIRELMAEFGAESYSFPPEFTERVAFYIRRYQNSDRPLMQRALNEYKGKVVTIRSILRQEHLPPDLAYIPLVESELAAGRVSEAGAAGPWQLTAATASALGLNVRAPADQRQDLRISTRAASRYLRNLILDFGAGSSVMLALAAYNSGPTRVKQAIEANVRDPIKQRDFWYLYRARALPAETREYVPRVIAAIVIGRNPERFGF